MNLTQQIDELLMARAPACDECLAGMLALPNIHAVEVRTQALAGTPYYERAHGKCALCGNQRMISMPIGPKGEKRPADVIGNAVRIMRKATGEEDTITDDGKDPAAKALGAKGGRKRAENMTPERRAEIARKAAEKRWEVAQ